MINKATENLQNEKNALVNELVNLNQTPIEEETVSGKISFVGYEFEDVFLKSSLSKILSDREFSKLFDGEVEFDEENYDVEELFEVDGELSINGEDFEENAYLTFDDGDLIYKIVLDSALNLSEINEDETLTFDFLGESIEISEWDGDEITFTEGKKVYISAGETKEGVTLIAVLEDEVYVKVGDETTKIGEGSVKDVGGIEIKVEDIVYQGWEGGLQSAELIISEDVETTIESGDEYEEDSIWEWQISDHEIGLILVEEFEELDDREGFNALDIEGKLCLPNDYLCVEYSGLIEEDIEEYEFEIEDTNLIYIKGKFLAGINDYDEVFLNLTDEKFYEEDDCENEITEDIYFGDSDVQLTFNSSGIYFDDVEFSVDLDSITIDGTDISSEEDNYRNEYGIVVFGPEDAVEDQEIKVSIPEEALEGLVKAY
jgi:hypothetical protein